VKQLLLACLSFAAATSAAQSPYAQSPYDPIPRADLQSPLIQRLLSSPLGDERAANRAQALLVLSDNHNEGETLRLFLQRRALKHVLGESFEFSGSVAEAVAAEKTDPEKFRSLVERALETVAIEYAPKKTMPPQPSPEAKHVGNGIWVETDAHERYVLHMPVVIRNGLKEAAREVNLQIGETEGGGPKPHYLYLQCKPQGRSDFPPGVAQSALCSGRERIAMNMEGAVNALVKREARLQTGRVAVSSGAFFKWYFHRPKSDAVGEAKAVLQGSGCRERGTCPEEEKKTAEKLKSERRPHVFGGLVLAALVIAGAIAASVRPRTLEGVFPGIVAGFLLATSLVALVSMWALLRPGVGYEGFLYAIAMYYMAIPHGIGLIVLGSAVANSGATRFRAFALTLALLAPALIFGAFTGFA
jgi:hypothetical protein